MIDILPYFPRKVNYFNWVCSQLNIFHKQTLEYALKAVKNCNVTGLAIKDDSAIAVVSQKKLPAQQGNQVPCLFVRLTISAIIGRFTGY